MTDGWSPHGWHELALATLLVASLITSALLMRRVRQQARRAQVQAHAVGRHDPLTGLLNRAGLRRSLQRALQRGAPSGRSLGVLVLDIDRFRRVNESLGQPLGDALLRAVADRIRTVVGPRDRLGRQDGDQFVVLSGAVTDAAMLEVMARNLLRAFEQPLDLGHRQALVTLSAGGAMAGTDGATDADELLQCAEAAMRAAKAAGDGSYRAYEPGMRTNEQQRLEMEARLRQALRHGEYRVEYQPMFDPAGERVLGVESLLRWKDPQRGNVPPVEFIPVLEQTGLIVPVGEWVLRESCRQALAWILAGARSLVLSVNVSPRQFAEAQFVATVAAALKDTGFPARRLQLEVTEGMLLEPSPSTMEKLAELVALGVRIAVDDFGIGYSSLAYLKRFPLATLKIDRLFVREVATDAKDRAIVRAIVELGRGLDLRVVAEGVETTEQAELLHELGCGAVQGFLFSRPLPAEKIGPLLATHPEDDDTTGAPISGWRTTMGAMLLEHPN